MIVTSFFGVLSLSSLSVLQMGDIGSSLQNGSVYDMGGGTENIKRLTIIEGKKSIKIKNGTFVIGKDMGTVNVLLGFSKCEEVQFENIVIKATGNETALAFAQCKNIKFINSRIEGDASVMLRFTGGSGLEARNSVFEGIDRSKIGIEVMPGHPHTFKNEAEARGIKWDPVSQWKGGTNLSAAIGPLGFRNSFKGNGTNKAVINIGDYPKGPIWKTDIFRPLASNVMEVTSKTNAKVVSESKSRFIIQAEGNFEAGKTYYWWTYNPKYDVKNIQIINCRFRDIIVAGFSGYFLKGFALQDNIFSGIRDDYGLGVEMGADGIISRNAGFYGSGDGKDPRVRIGLIGRMVNVKVERNIAPVHYNSMGQKGIGITSDTNIKFVGTQSPWMSNSIRSTLERGN